MTLPVCVDGWCQYFVDVLKGVPVYYVIPVKGDVNLNYMGFTHILNL